MKKKTWTYKKAKKQYRGFYEIKGKANRIFVLTPLDEKGEDKVFNSPSAAKKEGWQNA